MFAKNVGSTDQKIRLALGVVLVLSAVFILGALQGSVAGIVAAALGAIALVTGATRRCPTYVLFGVDTLEVPS
jgi:hypothetical protein